MATVNHAALDGSVVTVSAEADLSLPMTAFGFVRLRGRRQPQPLNIFPPGKSERVLASVAALGTGDRFELLGDVEVNGGTLRMAWVRRPTATGGYREFTYAVWEGSKASITTAVTGDRDEMEGVFDRLRFREVAHGIAVDTPVDESVRPLRCLKEVGSALLEIRPLTPTVTRTLPRGSGRRVAHGEMFRRTELSRDVLVVTPTAAVYAAPLGGNADDAHVDVAAEVAVTWGERS